jgi:death on curing protein
MITITKQNVIAINEETIIADGGNFMPPHNFLHESNLDYIIDIIDAEMFGQPLYPTVADKASVYLYNIICNHIFSDGNKRTGLGVALVFLDVNGYKLHDSVSNDILLEFVISVASGELTLDECRLWFQTHIEPL